MTGMRIFFISQWNHQSTHNLCLSNGVSTRALQIIHKSYLSTSKFVLSSTKRTDLVHNLSHSSLRHSEIKSNLLSSYGSLFVQRTSLCVPTIHIVIIGLLQKIIFQI